MRKGECGREEDGGEVIYRLKGDLTQVEIDKGSRKRMRESEGVNFINELHKIQLRSWAKRISAVRSQTTVNSAMS